MENTLKLLASLSSKILDNDWLVVITDSVALDQTASLEQSDHCKH